MSLWVQRRRKKERGRGFSSRSGELYTTALSIEQSVVDVFRMVTKD
jgi:hypothetical protein